MSLEKEASSSKKPKPIGIIGAMPQEIAILVNRLSLIDKQTIAGITFYIGTLEDIPVILIQSGIGKVNASIATTILIDRFSPKGIVNTGSAGGVSKNLKVGDVVISKSCIHHDVDVTAFGYKIGQMAQMPESFLSDEYYVQIAKKAATTFDNATIHHGLIASGDGFIQRADQYEQIRKHFPNVLAVDMEAAAIAQTCYNFKIPFVVIRAISDLADEQASDSFDKFIELASTNSAKMVSKLLLNIT